MRDACGCHGFDRDMQSGLAAHHQEHAFRFETPVLQETVQIQALVCVT